MSMNVHGVHAITFTFQNKNMYLNIPILVQLHRQGFQKQYRRIDK